jgi:hypothetical protein
MEQTQASEAVSQSSSAADVDMEFDVSCYLVRLYSVVIAPKGT